MEKVLLTRPIFDAQETAKILKKFNIQGLCSPLIEIKRKLHKPIVLSNYDIFLFTSKNGVRNFQINVKKLSLNKLIFAVGNETKQCLLDNGFINIVSTDGNLITLKKGIIKYLRNGYNILHPTFKKNDELDFFFFKHKCKYFHLQCYSTLRINNKKSLFKKFMISQSDRIITIYSSETARSFIEEVNKLNLIRFCKQKIFVVISKNVKKELGCLGPIHVEIAKKPNEKEMMNLVINKSRG